MHTRTQTYLVYRLFGTVWGSIVEVHDLSWADNPVLAGSLRCHEPMMH